MGSQQYLLNIPKTNTQIFGSNSRKIKSTKDWNEIILSWKVGTFNKFDKFINLSNLLKVPSMIDDSKIWLHYNTLYETTIMQHYNFLM